MFERMILTIFSLLGILNGAFLSVIFRRNGFISTWQEAGSFPFFQPPISSGMPEAMRDWDFGPSMWDIWPAGSWWQKS